MKHKEKIKAGQCKVSKPIWWLFQAFNVPGNRVCELKSPKVSSWSKNNLPYNAKVWSCKPFSDMNNGLWDLTLEKGHQEWRIIACIPCAFKFQICLRMFAYPLSSCKRVVGIFIDIQSATSNLIWWSQKDMNRVVGSRYHRGGKCSVTGHPNLCQEVARDFRGLGT